MAASYIKALENLRNQVMNANPVEQAMESIAPVSPRGFMPSIKTSNARPTNTTSTPQYDPLNFVRGTMGEIKAAQTRFQEKMTKMAEEEAKKTPAASFSQGFVSRRQAIEEEKSLAEAQTASPNALSGPAGGPVPRSANALSGPAGAPLPEIDAAAQAIKDIESGGGDYSARGPVIESGMYAGERAMGAYQVMPGNLPQWSKQALGREVSEQEFMDNPDIQDAIFYDQLRRNYERHGTWEDAASVWFTGQPVARSQNLSDGYMEAPEYIRRFTESFNRYVG